MKNLLRAALTAGTLSAGLLLAGCENFDPTAIFDAEIFNTKKKLPGERRPVFPEGTPGVPQGVPPELVKGHQPAPEPEALPKEATPSKQATAPKEATAEPAEAKPKPKAQPKAKPKVVAKPAEAASEDAPPSGAVTVRPSSSGPQWPDPPAAQEGPVAGRWPGGPAPGGGTAWPDPPAAR
jgi:hypothetical protein